VATKVFLYYSSNDCLTDIQFRFNMHKKVYMRASRLVFVLLEKLAEPFFELDQPSIGGNKKVKTRLTKTYNYYYILNLWEN
jgi:hypothetical protein